jgi:hypothetical protein
LQPKLQEVKKMRRFDRSSDAITDIAEPIMPHKRVAQAVERERMELALRILDEHGIYYVTAWGNTIRCPIDNPRGARLLAQHLGKEHDILVAPVGEDISIYVGNHLMAGIRSFENWDEDSPVRALGGHSEEDILAAAINVVARDIMRYR